MTVLRPADGPTFLAAAAPLLAVDEARHNLVYGIAGSIGDGAGRYPEYRLWVVNRDGRPVAAALRTPPHYAVVADAVDPAAIEELIGAVAEDEDELPGVTANLPTVGWFVEAWSRRTGKTGRETMPQGVYGLDAVRDVPTPRGASRPATDADTDLVVEWSRAFAAEAVPDHVEASDVRDNVVRRIAGEDDSGLWLWERDGSVVAMSGFGGPTPNGIRIGPVYTPPEQRGNGYATALVAAQSAWLLAGGRRFCFLYTDLGNPTSNAIYERIGYRRIAEASSYAFD